jgi:hypothetical protein
LCSELRQHPKDAAENQMGGERVIQDLRNAQEQNAGKQ